MGDSRYLLAFDFGGTKLAVAIADLDGHILAQSSIKSTECVDGADALQRSLADGRRLAEQFNAHDQAQFAGIGVSTMGITLPDEVLMAPNIPGWGSLRIPAAFEASFPGTPIRMMNDMKAGALAELRHGTLRGSRAGIYVNIGTGVGVTLTLGSEIIEGAHGAAGELAYNLLSSGQPVGYLDGVTPFENVVGGRAIGERASVQFGREMTCEDAFHLARSNQDARKFVDETVRELALHLTNLAIAWDPDKVVFGGGLVASQDVILPPITEYFQRFVPFPPTVEVAQFRTSAGLQGAIELARDASLQSKL